MNKTTLILSASDIEQIVRKKGLNKIMDELIENMKISFENYDPSQTIIPIRDGFNYSQPERGLVEWMPLHQRGDKVLIKMVGYHPDNPDKYNLPTILSTISDYDI